MNKPREYFSSRLGFVLSLMGVAIGAGNIWRFSRVVAQNGGGSFIIPWVIFLFIWSIPLIIAEIALGKLTRRAPIGALAKSAGPSYGWMGAFIALVTTGILFYYSVVVGWGIRYFVYSITGALTRTTNHLQIWENYIHSLDPLFSHVAAIAIGSFVIYKGIEKGIERSNKILVPALIVIILIILVRAVTLPGAGKGISYLFSPHIKDLLNYKVWLEALTQNAWDTGAGWGLLLVYAGYAHQKESVIVNGCITALTNNAVSLIMGITIFSTAFALESERGIESMISGIASTSTGLTFIYLPKLFQELPGGNVVHILFASIFFLAFVFAALSSMISMIQLTAQVFNELGMKKNSAILLTALLALFFGAFSALNMSIFDNQDWVWSVGLIVNGLFIAFAIYKFGADRFRKIAVNSSPSDFAVGKFFNAMILIFIPIQGIILLFWYAYHSISESSGKWWNPFQVSSVGTIILQWGLGLIIFLIFNKWLVTRTFKTTNSANQEKETSHS